MQLPKFSVQRLLLCVLFLAAAFGWIRYFGGGLSPFPFLLANIVLGSLLGAAVGGLLGHIALTAIAGAAGGIAFFLFAALA